jgi:acetoin utilization deacetylase AcuC-like enzyme
LADGSCPVGEFTWRSAYGSAQSAVAAAHAVLDGAPHSFALCRPPGHHARAAAAGGFCYLNNAAIAAQQLRQQFARVAVFDAVQPDAVVFSLGFDIYRDDPQSQVDVSSEGFDRLGQAVASLHLPTVFVQEGGDHLDTLEKHTRLFFNGVLNRSAG